MFMLVYSLFLGFVATRKVDYLATFPGLPRARGKTLKIQSFTGAENSKIAIYRYQFRSSFTFAKFDILVFSGSCLNYRYQFRRDWQNFGKQKDWNFSIFKRLIFCLREMVLPVVKTTILVLFLSHK